MCCCGRGWLTIGIAPARVERTVVRGLGEQSSAGPLETLLSVTPLGLRVGFLQWDGE